MGRKKQKGQNMDAASEAGGKKKRKFKFTFGKALTLLVGAAAVIYMFFSINLFYNFVKVMFEDPDAAKQQDAAMEALDEIYKEEEE